MTKDYRADTVSNGKYRYMALAAVVASLLTLGGFTSAPVLAADTAAGAGNGVAIGTGSNAPKAENVAIGKGASISYSGGVGQPSTGDIVIGGGAHTNNYCIVSSIYTTNGHLLKSGYKDTSLTLAFSLLNSQ